MIRIKKSNSNDYYEQGEKFKLKNNYHFYSTKTKFDYTSWYYEGTCYSGNGFALFGFSTDCGFVDFYPFNSTLKHYVLLQGDLKTVEQEQQQLIATPFLAEFPYTVGVSINIINNTFTVFYNNTFLAVQFNKGAKIKSIQAEIWGANSDNTDEEVSANFGNLPFTYDVSDLITWQNYKQMFTYSVKHYPSKSYIFIILFNEIKTFINN